MHWHRFKLFLKERSANFAVIMALAMIPIVIGSGAAVDYSRAYMVKSRLSNALDQAGLAVGSSNPSGDLNDVLNRYFFANYPTEKIGVPAAPSMTINDGVIELSVDANIETAFLKLIGINSITVTANSQIVRETTGLEIVLALDNTGSMANNGKIDALRVAAQDMIDILFKDEQNPEKLFMGLVPFVATVNIGKDQSDFVNIPSPPNDYGNSIDSEWKGCVLARSSGHDLTDAFDGGTGSSGKWEQYYWEAEDFVLHFGGQFFHSLCQNRWWFPSAFVQPYPNGRSGDVFVSSPSGPGSHQFSGQTLLDISPSEIQGFQNFFSPNPNLTFGPNQACPDPITPLTNSRSTLEAAVTQMMPWAGNGTMANLGAVWGWRVLSPTPPFTEGRELDDATFNKVLVILTDGQNLISQARGQCTLTKAEYNSHYSAYGYLSENNLGTSNNFNTAQAQLDQKLRTVCENIKDTGIIIYTIVFQLTDTSTQDLFRECATDADKFFNSPNNETLSEAFRAIGAELSNLRIGR